MSSKIHALGAGVHAAAHATAHAAGAYVEAKAKVADTVTPLVAEAKSRVAASGVAAVAPVLGEQRMAKLGELERKATALRQQAKGTALDVAEHFVDAGLDVVRGRLTAAITSDPDMPAMVRRLAVRAVEDVWPDVKIEVIGTIDKKVLAEIEAEGDRSAAPGGCLARVRASVLYAWQPFDRSIWGRMRSPGWWLLRLLTLVPVFGVRELVFALALLLVAVPGPPDEFQLVQFIMKFKAGQFVTGCLVAGLVGGYQYYACVNFDPSGRVHECHSKGPGAALELFAELGGLAFSIVLVWIAFWLLPRSERKGQRFYVERQHVGAADGEGHRKRGGRLWALLRWDLCSLVVALGLGTLAAMMNSSESNWDDTSLTGLAENYQFTATVYWTRVFYSGLTLPWLVVNLPVVKKIMTHALPTGFTRSGHCVAVRRAKRAPTVPTANEVAAAVEKVL